MDQFHPRRPEKRPHNLATAAAVMAIKRIIRPYLKLPNFVLAIELPDREDIGFYKMAVHDILDPHYMMDDEGRRALFVEEARDISGSGWELVWKFSKVSRAILFHVSEEDFTKQLLLTVDHFLVLTPPERFHLKAAGRAMGMAMTDEEATYFASLALSDVQLAMRPGRSVAQAISVLQSKSQAEPEVQPAPVNQGEIRLEDLSGYGEAKAWGLQLAQDIKAWNDGEIEWSDVDRGVLLNGSPGSGKTMYARALANTCGVKLILESAASWQAAGHLGDLLKAMRKSFKLASASRPSILFLDEFDSFGSRDSHRSSSNYDYKRQVINGLLECLDPSGGREGVVVLAASNKADELDPALMRPGRLEKIIDIPLPDAEARKAIARFHLPSAQLGDLDDFAAISEGWTGAQIAKAARDARRVARRAGRSRADETDLLSVLPPVVEFTPEELYRIAVHESGHAIVAHLLRPETLIKVSIGRFKNASAGKFLGKTLLRDPTPLLSTASNFSDSIAIFLAGMTAERVVFGDHFIGAGGDAGSDLATASDMATMMERNFGFGSGLLTDMGSGPRPLEHLRLYDHGLRDAVNRRLETEAARVRELLEPRRDKLDRLALLLAGKLELSAADVAEVIGQS
ncbi:AAA family ATPase [Rhizobium sp.]|uniref:AAA family ATPase n=1 Tax=Rhizobium sp. TaxID=391 RepID=UPI000DDC06C2